MRISERGQITIPKALRDRVGMNHNVEVEITAVAGRSPDPQADGGPAPGRRRLRHVGSGRKYRRLSGGHPGPVITAVDTSVLLDVFLPDERHGEESRQRLRLAYDAGAIIVCDIVYAELAPGVSQPGRARPGPEHGQRCLLAGRQRHRLRSGPAMATLPSRRRVADAHPSRLPDRSSCLGRRRHVSDARQGLSTGRTSPNCPSNARGTGRSGGRIGAAAVTCCPDHARETHP